ncbi:MAG: hypothetical protein GY847_11200 [Proteobacteria bacterium]|nr:hypothetical protein [Pseudomonadota bacterium]
MNTFVYWVVALFAIILAFSVLTPRKDSGDLLSYSDFMGRVRRGQVEQVMIRGKKISGTLTKGGSIVIYISDYPNPEFIGALKVHNVRIETQSIFLRPILIVPLLVVLLALIGATCIVHLRLATRGSWSRKVNRAIKDLFERHG